MAPSPDRHGALFAAKTTRPTLPKILVRTQCLDALKRARDFKILCISAPAGQGKTTLALSWLKEARTKAVWLSLDETDNSPVTFFPLLAEAFAVAFPRTAFDLPTVPVSVPFDPAAFARTFCRRLFAQVSGRYALVLDDFHSIREDGALASIIAVLLDVLPPTVQMVLLSRNKPPDFLAGWIARRQVFALDPSMLRFSVEETRALFDRVLGVPTTREQAEAIHGATEGWVTGMILLRERAHGAGSLPVGPLQPPSAEDNVANYFYHEVFRRLEPAVQDFMVRTSLFDAFSLKSLTAIEMPHDPATLIRLLVRRHLLAEVATREGTQFRYHDLLRQFLQSHVMALTMADRHTLIAQAAAVLLSEGRADKAVDLYLTYRQDEPAVALIEQIGLGAVFQGQRMKLRQWIRSLPPSRVEGRPWLVYLLGAGQEFEAPQEAEACYQRALQGFEHGKDPEGQLWSLGSLIFLGFYRGEDFRPLRTYSRRGRTLFKKHRSSLSPMVRAFFLYADAFSAVYAEGDPHLGLRKTLAAADLAHRHGFLPLYVMAMTYVSMPALFRGELRSGVHALSQADAAIHRPRRDPALSAQLLMVRAVMDSFRGETDKSVALAIESERICLEHGMMALLPAVQNNLARQRIQMGEIEAALAALASIRQAAAGSGNRFMASYASYCQAMGLLRTSQFSQALTHAEESVRLLKQCGAPLQLNLPVYLVGVCFSELGDPERARQHLLTALHGFEKARSHFYAFWVLLELAKVSLDRGDEREAKTYLTRALRLGKTEQYKDADGLLFKTKSLLMNRALEWNLEPEYVRLLMTHWKVTPPIPLTIHTLGRFEVRLHDRLVPPEAWKGRKTQQLLLALIALGGRQVSKARISDLLWPDADGDRAVTNFHTTLHRLQTVLGRSPDSRAGFVAVQGSQVSLCPRQCWSDCCAFDEAIRQAQRAERQAQWGSAQKHLETARTLYQGEYLPGFEEAWIVSRREDLHRKWLWVEQRLKAGV